MQFLAIYYLLRYSWKLPRTSALRKIEARLRRTIFTYCFRQPRFRIKYGNFGGKQY